MQRLVIDGENRIEGEIRVQGAKNSALPLLSACVLVNGEVRLENCPALSDVFAACRILNGLGCKCVYGSGSVTADGSGLSKTEVPDELMREMRSSIVFLGALLGRTGECSLSFPGGCELGPRPIDMHINALRQMGVEIKEEHGKLECTCPKGLRGAKISLPFPSVGATENVMLAACLAKGNTELCGAAREPEIADLANFLNTCGAKISGQGSDRIFITGVSGLHACTYRVMPDRIAACTLLSGAAITHGEIVLDDARYEDITAVIPVLEQMGCRVYCCDGRICLSSKKPLHAVKTIRTMPYPGFPTDAQAIIMAVLSKAEGTSVIAENIFENRYRHVDELTRMGADIKVEGRAAVIEGVKRLCGANVVATDLRGGAALCVAALAAEGRTVISNIKLIDRGYEEIEKQLSSVGAKIRRINS